MAGWPDTIAARAAGNPFFAEEIVRELAERGVLRGERGAYLSAAEVAEVSVPATLQATIAARIDRLDPNAKRTLSAAAVVGSRFDLDLLTVAWGSNRPLPTWWPPSSSIRSASPADPSMCSTIR